MPTIATVTKERSEIFREQAQAVEAEILGPLGDLLKSRWTTYHAMLPIARAAGMSASEVLGADLAEQNRKLNEKTRKIAKMVKGLQSGKLVLVYTQENKDSPVVLSVAYTHKIQGDLDFWPIVIKIIGGIGAAAVGAGILYMWNLGAKAATLFAEAQKTEAENHSREVAILEMVTRTNPEAAERIAGRLAKARENAADTDNEAWYEKIIGGATTAGSGVAVGLILGLLLLGKRK